MIVRYNKSLMVGFRFATTHPTLFFYHVGWVVAKRKPTIYKPLRSSNNQASTAVLKNYTGKRIALVIGMKSLEFKAKLCFLLAKLRFELQRLINSCYAPFCHYQTPPREQKSGLAANNYFPNQSIKANSNHRNQL